MKLKDVNLRFLNYNEIGCSGIVKDGNDESGEANYEVIRIEHPKRKECIVYADIEYENGDCRSVIVDAHIKRGETILFHCDEFYVIGTKTEYIIFDSEGVVTNRLSANIGKVITVADDHFICLRNKTITAYDYTGGNIASRKITDEELRQL